MRILLDDAHLGWDQAWDLTRRTLAYTNHTLLPEALEKWPLDWFEMLLPRHLEIIYEINRRFARRRADALPGRRGPRRAREPGRGRPGAEGPHGEPRDRRLAQHQRRGGDPLASCCGRRRSRTSPRCSPSASTTRPTASRRGAGCCWPTRRSPARSPTRSATAGSPTSASSAARAARRRRGLPRRLPQGQARGQGAVRRLARRSTTGQVVDPDTIFDCQVKRIHEYKRQLLNALRIVVLYDRLRANPGLDMPPRTFFFAGKAAPAYHLAKLIIKLINNLAATIDGDPAMRGPAQGGLPARLLVSPSPSG